VNFRSVLAFLLLVIVAGVCFSLGLWQLDRAAQRDALKNAIERGRQQAPLALEANVRSTELSPWRPAMARGHWSAEHTVLLENRNLDGRPGYWVATPLVLQGEPNNSKSAGTTAVLVLRGWLPRDLYAANALPEIPQETGLVEVRGELHAHVPRIFELWQWVGGSDSTLPAAIPAPGGRVPRVQNLTLSDYAEATGLTLLPTVLTQTQDTYRVKEGANEANQAGETQALASVAPAIPSALERKWPGPGLDSDQNRGYAVQWFSFSGIAVAAALIVLLNMARRRAAARSNRSK